MAYAMLFRYVAAVAQSNASQPTIFRSDNLNGGQGTALDTQKSFMRCPGFKHRAGKQAYISPLLRPSEK